MLKKCSTIVVLTLILIILCVACKNDNGNSNIDEKILNNAIENIKDAKNFELAYKIRMENQESNLYKQKVMLENKTRAIALNNTFFIPEGIIIVEGRASNYQDSKRIKNITEVSFVNNNNNKMMFENYVIENKDSVKIYRKNNDSYICQCFKKSLLKNAVSLNPTKPILYCLGNARNIMVVGKEIIDNKEVVKIEVSVPAKIYNEIIDEILIGSLFPFPTKKINLDNENKGCKATIWLDNNTNSMLKLSIYMKNDNVSESILMPMNIEYTIGNYNSNKRFTIPQECLNANIINY